MKILVTGGAGFIGHHLVRRLLREGHDVIVLDNLRRGSFERPALQGARLLNGDIRDSAACAAAMEGCDSVVHLAAQANVIGSADDPEYAFETNVTGTWNVACAARRAGVQHLIFASSREVYGEPPTTPVHETTRFAPKNVYGATKVACEVLLSTLLVDTLPLSVLRLANVIGSGDSGRVIPLWLRAVHEGSPLLLFGGDQEMDFVPVETVVDAILRLLNNGAATGPVNIGSGRSIPLKCVAERVLALHPAAASHIEVLPPRSIEVRRFCADTTRMREWLNIEPPADPLARLSAIDADDVQR